MTKKKSPIAGQCSGDNQKRPARAETTATGSMKTSVMLPSSPPTEIAGQFEAESQGVDAREAEGATTAVKTKAAVPSPPPSILNLIDLQRRRVHAIKAQSFSDRTCDSYVAHYLGYHSGLPEAEGRALFKQAADMRGDVEKQLKKDRKAGGQLRVENHVTRAPGLDGEGHALTVCSPIIVNTILSRAGWDALRKSTEARMCEIARFFPVWTRAAEVAGFAELGLAVILAEAGNDLTAYPHPMHLWKRLGLAPYKGKAMSSQSGLTKDEWITAGYNPARRGRMAGDIGAALFFAKDKNAYGAVYAARREHTALTHPDWTKAHSDNDARRIMLKAFVADLWRWWQECAQAQAADVSRAA